MALMVVYDSDRVDEFYKERNADIEQVLETAGCLSNFSRDRFDP